MPMVADCQDFLSHAGRNFGVEERLERVHEVSRERHGTRDGQSQVLESRSSPG